MKGAETQGSARRGVESWEVVCFLKLEESRACLHACGCDLGGGRGKEAEAAGVGGPKDRRPRVLKEHPPAARGGTQVCANDKMTEVPPTPAFLSP